MSDKAINVREVLQQNSYTTTVDELRNRGKSRVRVINAEQISALIEEAVNRVVAGSSGMDRDEVKKLVDRSKEEFRRRLSEREKELAEHRERLQLLEQAKEALGKSTAELERLRIVEGELRRQNETMTTQVAELKLAVKSGSAELSAEAKAEIDRLRKTEASGKQEIDGLRQREATAVKEKEIALAQLAETRRMEAEIRKGEAKAQKEKETLLAEIAELKQSIKELSKRPEAAPAAAAMPPEMVEVLKALSSEVASMKAGLKEVAQKAAEPTTDKAVAERMEEFSRTLSDRLDKIGKKVGISAGAEDQAVILDNIFSEQEKLESNIENVEIKERRGSGISGAIERIKSLRNKKGDKKG